MCTSHLVGDLNPYEKINQPSNIGENQSLKPPTGILDTYPSYPYMYAACVCVCQYMFVFAYRYPAMINSSIQ